MPAATTLATQLGYELVDVELVHENTGRFLRFYIDREGGISLDDLESFHRQIQPMMDDIDYDYMEVSSPGADRPLKKPEDFKRAEGMPVEVRLYRPIDGCKRFTGELVGLVDDRAVLRTDSGERAFPLKQVALVAPIVPVDEDELTDLGDT
jgi:ribosome maturation factor RimP